MTDKEIIIDSVDVSKCIHIDNWKHCNCCNDLIKTIYPKASQCLIEEDLRCEIYSNCYYKQLKRKEQECEELKIMLKDLSYENQKFCYQIEEQTKQLEPFKDEYFKGLDNVVIAKLAKKSIRITAENSKLEQILTEIKEIAEKQVKRAPDGETFARPEIKQILQKIDEVENDRCRSN